MYKTILSNPSEQKLKRNRKQSINTPRKRIKLQPVEPKAPLNNSPPQTQNLHPPTSVTSLQHPDIKTPTREPPAAPHTPKPPRILQVDTKNRRKEDATKRGSSSSEKNTKEKARISPSKPENKHQTILPVIRPKTHDHVKKHPLPPRNDPPDKSG
jgi:hypothetical protein